MYYLPFKGWYGSYPIWLVDSGSILLPVDVDPGNGLVLLGTFAPNESKIIKMNIIVHKNQF